MAQPHFFPNQTIISLAASPAPGTSFPDWPARPVSPRTSAYTDAHQAFEVQFITQALRENGGNISRTAEAIGMSRRNLQIKIQKLGIDVEGLKRKN